MQGLGLSGKNYTVKKQNKSLLLRDDCLQICLIQGLIAPE